MLRLETVKPVKPAFGREPLPVAPRHGFRRPRPLPRLQTARWRSGWVVRFHLHDDMRVFLVERYLGFPPHSDRNARLLRLRSRTNCLYRRRPCLGMRVVRVANHTEEGFRLFFAVEDEIGVEDFVAAVFAVCLCEHHQFNIGRIVAAKPDSFNQIIDFVGGECKPISVLALTKASLPPPKTSTLEKVSDSRWWNNLEAV